ncbi:MAG: hypothetical protein QM730_26965 [Anaerolineales bacterium]
MVSEHDLQWLKWNYPGIYYVPDKKILQGCLWFKMSYSFSSSQAVINPPDHINSNESLVIEDVFDLTIEIDYSIKKATVREVGGRILHTKSRWRLSNADVHMYQDGSLCLCPEPEEKLLFHEGFSLRTFFYSYLIPNLYYQSYLGRFGKEPWRSSSHGPMGILEGYVSQTISKQPIKTVVGAYVECLPASLERLILKKKVAPDLSCGCGSTKKFRECHTLAFTGLKKLHADYWVMRAGKSRKKE